MNKRLLVMFLFGTIINGFAVSNKEVEIGASVVHVAVPDGAPAIAISKLSNDNLEFSKGYTTTYQVVKSPSLMAEKLISGEADIAIVPTNLAAILKSKDVDVRIAGSVVWGVLYLITSDNIDTWDDLKGREIFMLGRGLTPDITLRYILMKNGIDPDNDVTFRYVESGMELAPAFISGKSSITIMPEPMLTKVLSKKKDTKIFADLQEEWKKISPSKKSYPQASLVISGDLIDRNPEYVESFIMEFSKGITWINRNPEEAGILTAKISKGLKAPILTNSIPRSSLRWESAVEARSALDEYFGILYEFAPKTIGGKIPGDSLYFE